ncbi:MAG: hypothetical protein ACYTBR_16735, partial [Planctomycetota bacterium]
NDEEQPPEQCYARRARVYWCIRLRPRRTSPATPEPSSSSGPGSGMKRIARITNDPCFSLEPSCWFVMTWFGVTSCTTPLGCAVEVVVETGACAQPCAVQVVMMRGGPPVGVIWSSTV